MDVNFREIKKEEYGFLNEMLYEALFVPKGKPKFPKSILENPEISKYVDNWNTKAHDLAILAVKDGKLLGAIWGRKFQVNKKGYGFIDEKTPEISMAVREADRNKRNRISAPKTNRRCL